MEINCGTNIPLAPEWMNACAEGVIEALCDDASGQRPAASQPRASEERAPPWVRIDWNEPALKGRHMRARFVCAALSGLGK